jgi:serine/threonine protein kinase
MALSAGTRVGPYQIVSLAGAGGMVEVYRARDPKLERDVALKLLPEAFAGDPERAARFEREAKLLAALNHPNIASIYGFESGALVMELVEGVSAQGPMSFDDAWHVALQVIAIRLRSISQPAKSATTAARTSFPSSPIRCVNFWRLAGSQCIWKIRQAVTDKE